MHASEMGLFYIESKTLRVKVQKCRIFCSKEQFCVTIFYVPHVLQSTVAQKESFIRFPLQIEPELWLV